MKSRYCLVTSDQGDWVIAAKMSTGKRPKIKELFAGHSHSQAYEAILEDLGINIPSTEVDMGEGCYEVTPEHFISETA